MSLPKYPQSNDFAEKCVQTTKKRFLKCKNDKTDPNLGLLNLRNTPISSSNMSYSPAMLLMGRRCLTKLQTNSELLKPKIIDHELYKKEEIKSKEKKNLFMAKEQKVKL